MKKFKLFLIAATVIILGSGSYILYTFKFKQYDVADEEVTEIVADPYKVELPGGVTLLIDDQGKVVEKSTTLTVGTVSTSSNTKTEVVPTSGTTSNSTDSTNSTTGNKNTKKPTVASIKDKYRPALEGLQSQADSKINALIGRAVTEYTGKKEKGEGIDFGYFYSKYMSAANNLEASTDTIFQAVLKAVEKDLTNNGYDKSYAKSFKDEYEATKKARRDSILSKALGSK